MVIKKWFEKLKRGIKGEIVRDYSAITRADDCLNACLKRDSDKFSFSMNVSNKEHGTAEFKVPVSQEMLKVLQQLVTDINSVRVKGDRSKGFRLRFRDGQIDLLITYTYAKEMPTPRQRTAPVNGRTVKLLEEMLSDAEMLLENEFSLYDIEEDD
mgnify:CR=1 FL=1